MNGNTSLEARWLTDDRAKAFGRVLFALTLVAVVVWVALSKQGVDITGKPLGTDFVSFWTASELALRGRVLEVYDISAHWSLQKELFGPSQDYTAFFYPPVFLLICWPLATLPYLWSLVAWVFVSGWAYVPVVRRYLGPRLGLWPILAFPAVILNAGHGQNGFLNAALIGGGALLLDKRPILAGVCFGAMVYKPQLAIVIPFALLASRRWTTIGAAAATAASLVGATIVLWGLDPWRAFFAAAPLARHSLEQNWVGNEKMPSLFAAVRLLGGGLGFAYGAQLLLGLGVCAVLFHLQRRAFRSDAEGPAMVAAGLLSTPFILDYDLTLLAIPIAWLARRALAGGFLPGERLALALAYLLPLYVRTLAGKTGIPSGPFVVCAIFAYVVARGVAGASAELRAEARGATAHDTTIAREALVTPIPPSPKTR